jgi:hypothetical protein
VTVPDVGQSFFPVDPIMVTCSNEYKPSAKEGSTEASRVKVIGKVLAGGDGCVAVSASSDETDGAGVGARVEAGEEFAVPPTSPPPPPHPARPTAVANNKTPMVLFMFSP